MGTPIAKKKGRTHTNSSTISFNGGMTVVHLDELVPHERPSGQIIAVELKRALEVLNRLGMIAPRRVKVA